MADDDRLEILAERFERRLTDECGKLRTEIGAARAETMSLRAEMIDRNAELLKWLLAFFVAQTAALAALMALFR
jgi:hypothetical protein